MTDAQPSQAARRTLDAAEARRAETDKLLGEADSEFAIIHDTLERNHIAWKLKRAIGPRVVGAA